MSRLQRSGQRSAQRPQIQFRTSRNLYDLDTSKIPDGMSYEWKAQTISGAPNDAHMIMYEMNGWEPVPADRHPELLGSRAVAGAQIVLGGQILMQRPAEITEYSRELDAGAAQAILASQLHKVHGEAKAVSPKLDGVRRGAPEPIPED